VKDGSSTPRKFFYGFIVKPHSFHPPWPPPPSSSNEESEEVQSKEKQEGRKHTVNNQNDPISIASVIQRRY